MSQNKPRNEHHDALVIQVLQNHASLSHADATREVAAADVDAVAVLADLLVKFQATLTEFRTAVGEFREAPRIAVKKAGLAPTPIELGAGARAAAGDAIANRHSEAPAAPPVEQPLPAVAATIAPGEVIAKP